MNKKIFRFFTKKHRKKSVKHIQVTQVENYKYPDPDQITINEADFRLQMKSFSEAVKNKISLSDFLFLLSVWVVAITANFKNVWIFSGDTILGGYVAFIAVATIMILVKLLKVKSRDNANPDKKVESIKSNCYQLENKKSKKLIGK